uniref:PhoLip_ATPase_C domain-containing protein n=1 Tax=Brugia timori TaxID=42155 RepID=A0A0R3R757_9BILA
LLHLILSVMLFYGVTTKRINFILPWFFTVLPLIILSTIYAIIWWSGDIFDTQLIMSVTEFILSLPINSICVVIVLLFFFHIKKSLESINHLENVNYGRNLLINKANNKIPTWKNDWNVELSKEFTSQKRMMKQKDRNYHLLHNSYICTSSLSKENSKQLHLTADHLAEHNRILSNEDKRWRYSHYK